MAEAGAQTEQDRDSMASLHRLADLLRSARLNQLYYGNRLAYHRRLNFILDGLLAVGTSAAVGSFVVWSSATGALAWQLMVGIVAILTVLKPLFDFPKKIERYSTLFGRYSDLYYELKGLHGDIRLARRFDETARKVLDRAEARYRALAPEDDPSYSTKKIGELTARINKEIPAEYLWISFEQQDRPTL